MEQCLGYALAMNRPTIPYRITRMRAGESTYTDLADPEIRFIVRTLEGEGYGFELEPFDGGVFFHCWRSPHKITDSKGTP